MMIRSGGIPELILMTEVSGSNDQELRATLQKLRREVTHAFGYTSRVLNAEESQKYWRIRRESFNLLRKHVKGLHTAPCIDDVVVPVESLPQFMPEIQKVLDGEKFIYTIAGHAGNGNFHIIPLLDFKKESTKDQVLRLSDTVYTLVKKYHGSITGEHNDGIVRTPYLGYMFSEKMLELFKQVKEGCDPSHIFNPGKKVGGTKEYLYEHIIKE
jgi:FAD/FMN-containing dehydrogenase